MPFGNPVAVPHPSNLLAGGIAPAYRRRVAYLNSTTGVIEGDREEIFLYNGRGSATVAGGVYRMLRDGDEETDPRVATCTTQSVAQRYVVSAKIVADAAWGWFTLEGYVDALVEGTTDVAVDDTLKVVSGTAANAFVQDTAAAVPTAASLAIACAAQTANSSVLTKVRLLDSTATVA